MTFDSTNSSIIDDKYVRNHSSIPAREEPNVNQWADRCSSSVLGSGAPSKTPWRAEGVVPAASSRCDAAHSELTISHLSVDRCHQRSNAQRGLTGSRSTAAVHSHTCEHIHMNAHMAKGLQLQAHCCCCTALHVSTSTWTHIWARDFSFRSTAGVAQPYM